MDDTNDDASLEPIASIIMKVLQSIFSKKLTEPPKLQNPKPSYKIISSQLQMKLPKAISLIFPLQQAQLKSTFLISIIIA